MPRAAPDFEGFCRREYPRLVGALGLYTGNAAVAEELAQEALVRAWRHWRKVSEADDPAAWVFVVGFNLAKSHLRRLRAEGRARRRLPRASEVLQPDLANEDAMARALAALPHGQRIVLVLRYYAGFTLQEIATHLDVPLSTVKSRSARGLHRLRNEGPSRFGEVPDAS